MKEEVQTADILRVMATAVTLMIMMMISAAGTAAVTVAATVIITLKVTATDITAEPAHLITVTMTMITVKAIRIMMTITIMKIMMMITAAEAIIPQADIPGVMMTMT